MEVSAQLMALLNQALIALLILGAAALAVIAHRKRLLDLLVAKQAELIDKLRQKVSQPAVRSERSLAHLRDTVKWLQARYRRDFAYAQAPPQQATEPEQLRQVVMAAALQTLDKELDAIEQNREPQAAWQAMEAALNTLLEPVYAGMAEKSAAPPADAGQSDAAAQELRERLAELEWALRAERARRERLEREAGEQPTAIAQARPAADWVTRRRDGLGEGSKASVLYSDTEAGELSRKALADSLQKSEAEMKNLRNALAGQHELVAKLKYKMAQQGDGEQASSPEWSALERTLKESETCIRTLEMDLDETHAYAHRLEDEVAALKARLAERAASPAEAPRETKELTDTIKTLEDAAAEYAREIESLRKALAQEKNINFVLRDQLGMAEPEAEAGARPEGQGPAEPPA